MLLLAHRGYHAAVPENTLAAFAAALEFGVDGLETDVRVSADGEPVLLHDRLTPQGHAVAALTRAALEREWGRPVPVLADALEAFPEPLWNIEIKTPAAAPAALAVLGRYRRSRRLLVTSFRHDVVARCAAGLDVAWGLLFAHVPADPQRVVADHAVHPRVRSAVWDYGIIDGPALGIFAAAGWSNYVYGVLTADEWRHCASLGVAGVMTDDPALAGRAGV